jgi:hypothetical protein
VIALESINQMTLVMIDHHETIEVQEAQDIQMTTEAQDIQMTTEAQDIQMTTEVQEIPEIVLDQVEDEVINS